MRDHTAPILPPLGHIERGRASRETPAFSNAEPPRGTVDIVFDGPPGHAAGRFVEVEDLQGRSVNVGKWVERENGQWALRVTLASAEVPRTGVNTDVDIVAAVLAGHGIPDHSAAEHAVDALRAQGRLR